MLVIAMKFFLPIICLLSVSRSILGIHYGDKYPTQEPYDGFIKRNASCYPRDSCTEDRNDDSPEISYRYSCSCNAQCSKFGTCCIDSPYRYNVPPTHKCRSTEGVFSMTAYFMIEVCSDNTHFYSDLKRQCEKEWNGEDDILMITPVTSLDTSTTYKNYYCFRCHETTDKFILWNVHLMGNYQRLEERPDDNDNDYKVTYNQAYKTWVAINVKKPFSIPVKLNIETPLEIRSLPISCDKYIISDCHYRWSDKSVLDECRAYSSIVHAGHPSYRKYKNPYCALCNFVSLDNIFCSPRAGGGSGGGVSYNFRILFDFNRLCKDSHKWDGSVCRKTVCNMPEYVIKNGKCVPP